MDGSLPLIDGLPSVVALKQLPWRALVAYAARCARRVLPPVERSEMESGMRQAIEQAIRVAEDFAGGQQIDQDAAKVADAAKAYAHARRAPSPACAAHDAVLAVVLATRAAVDARFADEPAGAADAASADAADTAADTAAYRVIAAATISDCKRLLELNLGHPNELGQSINTSEEGPLGPLWPNGSPWASLAS
jgi:hypothetical protein